MTFHPSSQSSSSSLLLVLMHLIGKVLLLVLESGKTALQQRFQKCWCCNFFWLKAFTWYQISTHKKSDKRGPVFLAQKSEWIFSVTSPDVKVFAEWQYFNRILKFLLENLFSSNLKVFVIGQYFNRMFSPDIIVFVEWQYFNRMFHQILKFLWCGNISTAF